MKIEHLDLSGRHNSVPDYVVQGLLDELAATENNTGIITPDGRGGLYYVDTSKPSADSQSEIDQETSIGSITDEHGKVFFVTEIEMNGYITADLLSVVPQSSSERVIVSWPVRYRNGDREFSSHTVIVPNQEFSNINEFRNVGNADRLPFDWFVIMPPDNENIDYGCYKITATRAICDNPAKDGEYYASEMMIDLREGSVVTRINPAEYLDKSWYDEMAKDMMDFRQIPPGRGKFISRALKLVDSQSNR